MDTPRDEQESSRGFRIDYHAQIEQFDKSARLYGAPWCAAPDCMHLAKQKHPGLANKDSYCPVHEDEPGFAA